MDALPGKPPLRRRDDRRGNLVGHEGVVHEERHVGPGGRGKQRALDVVAHVPGDVHPRRTTWGSYSWAA
jgi:hypothetical protein